MSHDQKIPEGKDPALWDIAKKRADFKNHLVTYLIVNGFFLGLWYFTGGRHDDDGSFPWPVWSMLSWGVWLAFHFAEAYLYTETNSTEREYEKLINKK